MLFVKYLLTAIYSSSVIVAKINFSLNICQRLISLEQNACLRCFLMADGVLVD